MSTPTDNQEPESSRPVPSRGTPLHQIYEGDLADLERILPEIAGAMMPNLNNRLRMQWRRVQKIISDVRWNYGPPGEVIVIPADGDKP